MRSFVFWQSIVAARLTDKYGFTEEEANEAIARDLAGGHDAFFSDVTTSEYAHRLSYNRPPRAPQATQEARQ